MNWNPFKKRLTAQPATLSPPPASPVLSDIHLKKWFEDQQNVTRLRQALAAHPILRDWLAVAWASIPRNYPNTGEVLNDTMASVALGRANGYMMCLDLLQSCWEYRKQAPKELPMNFPKSLEETLAELNKTKK